MSAHDNCDICAKLDALTIQVAALVASFDAGKARSLAVATKASGAAIDLDSEFGNFTVRKDPPRWKGRSYAGKRLSETEPDFLDALGGFKLWAANKDREAGDERKAGFNALDAERCAGWAARLRNGWKSKPETDGDSEIPF